MGEAYCFSKNRLLRCSTVHVISSTQEAANKQPSCFWFQHLCYFCIACSSGSKWLVKRSGNSHFFPACWKDVGLPFLIQKSFAMSKRTLGFGGAAHYKRTLSVLSFQRKKDFSCCRLTVDKCFEIFYKCHISWKFVYLFTFWAQHYMVA